MTAVVRALGVKCNIQCQYCYQNPQRDSGSLQHTDKKSYSVAKVMDVLAQKNEEFVVFGGEPLLLAEDDLETLWAWGYERFGHNNIQTNGTLINDNHIKMFRAYNVFVGISIDGPGELSDARWAGSIEGTRSMTAKSQSAIERLCREGIPPGVIVTLNRSNAVGERLQQLMAWFEELQQLGVQQVKLHSLEVTNELVRQRWALSDRENVHAFLALLRFEKERLTTLHFDVFSDLRKLLLGQDELVACVFTACDPYATEAVYSVTGNGETGNCLSANDDGLNYSRAPTPGFERYLALYSTPYEHGGCKDCRFFLMCKGQCPGSAIGRDWRNRTEHCHLWLSLLTHLEAELIEEGLVPLSTHSKRKAVEDYFIRSWTNGRNTSMNKALRELGGDLG